MLQYRECEKVAKYLLTVSPPTDIVDGHLYARRANTPSGVGVAATIKALATRETIAVLKCIVGSFSGW